MIRVPRQQVRHGDVIGLNEGQRVIVCCPPNSGPENQIIPVSQMDDATDVTQPPTWHRQHDPVCYLPFGLSHVMVLHRAQVVSGD